MRQQVVSPDHWQALPVKKSSSKATKGEDFSENGRRVAGEGLSVDEEKPASKMPGGRLKGLAFKEHKVNKDHKDRKVEKDIKEMDHIKAEEETGAAEVMDDEGDGHRRVQDGETLLQWGQRKRPRHREPSGLLKTSIQINRRVVRADKQVPPQQVRGSGRPSMLEGASGLGKRSSDVSGMAAPIVENDHAPLSSAQQPLSGGDPEENGQQHAACPSNREKVPASANGALVVATAYVARQVETESSQEKSLAVEKMNLELFEWPKIMVSLTRKEKEDDFNAMKGTKLPQRPKRRAKTVEKNVNFISPGAWLCELTRERYEVREKKTVKKRPRGLKAMGSVDSDSE